LGIIKTLKDIWLHLKPLPVVTDEVYEGIDHKAKYYSELNLTTKTVMVACDSKSLEHFMFMLSSELQFPSFNQTRNIYFNDSLCAFLQVTNVTNYPNRDKCWNIILTISVDDMKKSIACGWLQTFIYGLNQNHQKHINNGNIKTLILMCSFQKRYDYNYALTLNQESWD